jgi:hypothetical protein
MRNFLLSLVFILFSFPLAAQPDNWYFSLTMGGCWPSGSFGITNPEKEDAGFAKNGFGLSIDATYPLGRHWGLKGSVMLNSNPVDRNGMGTMMENRMKEQVPFNETEREYLTLSVNSWMSNSIIAGPVYSIYFKRVAWDFQAMAGMNVTYLPDQELLFANSANNWSYLQRNTNNVNVTMDFLAGTAWRINMTEKVQLKLSLDYQISGSTTKYEELKSTKENNVVTTEVLNSGSVWVQKGTVIGAVGFVYYL